MMTTLSLPESEAKAALIPYLCIEFAKQNGCKMAKQVRFLLENRFVKITADPAADRLMGIGLLAIGLVAVERTKTVRFVEEWEALDRFGQTFGGETEAWREILDCDFLFLNCVDGENSQRNLPTAIPMLVDSRVKYGKHTALSTSLDHHGFCQWYSDKLAVQINQYFKEIPR